MQDQASPLEPSRDGTLFVSGFATSVRIERSHLLVRSGAGRAIREARFSRINNPQLRRLVVFGKGGSVSFEALAWLHAIGCTFAHLSRDGDVLACSGGISGGQAALRRAQALAMDSAVGLELTRYVLDAKVDGQRRVSESFNEPDVTAAIEEIRSSLGHPGDSREAMKREARAAVAYWDLWADEPMTFARADAPTVPERWRVVGDRRSALSVTSPRNATTAAQACLNYAYALGEFACRIALQANGLDPDIGWLHRDAPYRASAALDLLEVLRPSVDRFLLNLLRSRTFAAREFIELGSGQVRLATPLAKMLAESLFPMLEAGAHEAARKVARLLADSASSPVRLRVRRGPRKIGKVEVRLDGGSKVRPVASACRDCGVILHHPDRQICDKCLPHHEQARTDKLSNAGKATLAGMRALSDDPARSPEATAKKRETSRSTSLAMRAWEREHGGGNPELYEREVLPRIRAMTVPQLMNLTGLSQFHCWKVRKGERRLHARHWDSIVSID